MPKDLFYESPDGKPYRPGQWNKKLLPETVVLTIDERALPEDELPEYSHDQDPRAFVLVQNPDYIRRERIRRELHHIARMQDLQNEVEARDEPLASSIPYSDLR